MSKPVKLVIFDLDGTLLDTGGLSAAQSLLRTRACLMRCMPAALNSGGDARRCPSAESLVCDVSQRVLAAHGATLTPEAVKAGLGKRPLEAWQAVVDLLGLPVPAQQLYDESEPLLTERCGLGT